MSDVDDAWHGEIAEREPALYAITDAAGYAHGKGMKSYLIMMAVRLLEMRRLLKPTGSVYLHCDPTASHYLKTLMDAVLGQRHFRNEIVWCYTGPGSPKMRQFNRKHDTIFWYSRSEQQWCFNADEVRIGHHGKTKDNFKQGLRGSGFVADTYDLSKKGKVPETWWVQQKGNGLAIAARQKQQYVGYPTQKPIALLDRIIRASSNEGDMVLDPFCGCATTCVAAEKNSRQWSGIDLSPRAVELVKMRLQREVAIYEEGGLIYGPVINRTDIPARTDLGELPNYRTHRHTLYGRQEGSCSGCEVLFPFRNMTVDHIVPQSKGRLTPHRQPATTVRCLQLHEGRGLAGAVHC